MIAIPAFKRQAKIPSSRSAWAAQKSRTRLRKQKSQQVLKLDVLIHTWCVVRIDCADAHLVLLHTGCVNARLVYCAHWMCWCILGVLCTLGVLMHTWCWYSTQEVDSGWLQVWNQSVPHNKFEISLDCINRILSQQTKHLVSLCIHDLLSETSFPLVLTSSVFFVAIHLDLTTLWCVVVGVWRLKSRLHIF